MGRWNERVERVLFGAERRAPELPPGETTPVEAFPSFFISHPNHLPIAPGLGGSSPLGDWWRGPPRSP